KSGHEGVWSARGKDPVTAPVLVEAKGHGDGVVGDKPGELHAGQVGADVLQDRADAVHEWFFLLLAVVDLFGGQRASARQLTLDELSSLYRQRLLEPQRHELVAATDEEQR